MNAAPVNRHRGPLPIRVVGKSQGDYARDHLECDVRDRPTCGMNRRSRPPPVMHKHTAGLLLADRGRDRQRCTTSAALKATTAIMVWLTRLVSKSARIVPTMVLPLSYMRPGTHTPGTRGSWSIFGWPHRGRIQAAIHDCL